MELIGSTILIIKDCFTKHENLCNPIVTIFSAQDYWEYLARFL